MEVDLPWAAELYAQYPQVLGRLSGIWDPDLAGFVSQEDTIYLFSFSWDGVHRWCHERSFPVLSVYHLYPFI